MSILTLWPIHNHGHRNKWFGQNVSHFAVSSIIDGTLTKSLETAIQGVTAKWSGPDWCTWSAGMGSKHGAKNYLRWSQVKIADFVHGGGIVRSHREPERKEIKLCLLLFYFVCFFRFCLFCFLFVRFSLSGLKLTEFVLLSSSFSDCRAWELFNARNKT